MKFYVAVYRPNNYLHSVEITEKVMADIDLVNAEMVRAGIRLFVGGFKPPGTARSINLDAHGNITIEDRPYLETTHYVDGFWVLELPTIDDAVAWGKKAASACRGSVEVRPFH